MRSQKLYQIALSLAIVLCSVIELSAQQDAMYTHYGYNTLAINPAYAGSRDALTVTALHRSQWVGFEGAPTTQTLTLHTPIINQNSGVGFSFINVCGLALGLAGAVLILLWVQQELSFEKVQTKK